MRMIKHMTSVKLSDGNFLVVNCLNGTTDYVNNGVHGIIKTWQSKDCVIPTGDMEESLYESLLARGYFVTSYDQETEIKQGIIHKLRPSYLLD